MQNRAEIPGMEVEAFMDGKEVIEILQGENYRPLPCEDHVYDEDR